MTRIDIDIKLMMIEFIHSQDDTGQWDLATPDFEVIVEFTGFIREKIEAGYLSNVIFREYLSTFIRELPLHSIDEVSNYYGTMFFEPLEDFDEFKAFLVEKYLDINYIEYISKHW